MEIKTFKYMFKYIKTFLISYRKDCSTAPPDTQP